jgi:hypothetical protein
MNSTERLEELEKLWSGLIRNFNKIPVDFNFKQAVLTYLGEKRSDVYTHYIHSYPAKMFLYIPTFFFSKNEDEKRIAVPFVRGEITATQRQLKLLEVVRKIDNVDLAKEYLIGILYFLKISGFSTLVVAVDEFEYLFSLVSKSDQSIYLALLRGLYDLPIQVPDKLKNRTANMVLFIGISESGMQRLTELENIEKSTGGPINPLMRRITDKVLLNPLKKDYVRKLIEKRLSLNRVKGMYEKEPLIPFTEDYVDYIYKITGGRPSDIIVRCDHVLDVGLERRISKLTAEFAKEVFKERGFSYE